MLVKPNEAIVEWFDKLTPDQRVDTAFLVLSMLPGFSISILSDTEKMKEDFISFLKGEDKELTSQLIGRVLFARASINWIIRKRGTSEPWGAEEDINKMIAMAEREGHPPGLLEQTAMQFPLRKKQWSKAGEAWRELCDTVISDDSIEEWERDLFLARQE
jgi:hypothetical protein